VPFDLSMGELLVILFVALLVFGGKLPDTARKLGHALSEFKRGMRDELRKIEDNVREDEAPPKWRPERPEKTEPPKAEPEQPEQEKAAPEQTGPDETTPDETAPEKTEQAADQPAEPTRRDP